MASQLLMIAIGAWAMSMVRVVREPGRYGAYYLYLLILIGALLVIGAGDGLSKIGLAGIVLVGTSVVLPFILDAVSRALWDRSWLRTAAVLATLRGHLLLGGAAMLQAEIWSALAKFPREGSMAAVNELRSMYPEWDGRGATIMLDDQIFGTYAIDGQWEQALANLAKSTPDPMYVHRVTAALRMRALLEDGRFENAASVLSEVCGLETPSPFSMRVQWVFLAMTGAPEVEAMVRDTQIQQTLGMSKASAFLWEAIYQRAKGKRAKATQALDASLKAHTVQRVFHQRMVQVVRESLQDYEAPQWPEELASVQQGVLNDFERARALAPKLSSGGAPLLTLFMIAGLLARLLAVGWSGGGVDALLGWGALSPEIWANQAWWRVLTAPWLMVDLFGWLIVAYLWWLSAGQGPQRVGLLRWVTALLVVPSVSLGIMAAASPDYAGAGASSMALVAAITTALWSGSQGLATPGRSRSWTVVVGLLLVAKLVGATLDPGGGPSAAMAMLLCAVMVSLLLGPVRNVLPSRPSLLAYGVVGVWLLAWPAIRLDPGPAKLVQAEPLRCTAMGVDWEVPGRFRWPQEALTNTSIFPEFAGWIDAGAWQGRARVRLGVLKREAGLEPSQSSVAATWPKLVEKFTVTPPGIKLPEEIAKAEGLRVLELRQEGQAVAMLAERDLPGTEEGEAQTVVMLWQPRRPSQAYVQSQLHALLSAKPSEGGLAPCPGVPELVEQPQEEAPAPGASGP